MSQGQLDYHVPDDAERAEMHEVLCHAFGVSQGSERTWLELVGHDNLRVLRGPDGVRACLGVVPMGQYFGGRSLPIEGIVGVGVRSDWLRRGMASELMRRALRAARERGAAASTLFASTWSLYRGVGYECAGERHMAKLSPTLAPSFRDPPLPVRRATSDDMPAVQALYRSLAPSHAGHLDRGPYVWPRLCGVRLEVAAQGLLIDDDEGLAGYVYYRKHPISGNERHRVEVTDACARTPAAWRRIWTALGDLGTMVDHVELPTAPHDPMFLHHPDPRFRMQLYESWMLRVTDVVAMLEGRGYGPGVAGCVDLRIDDDVLPEQAGAWRLEVEAGQGRLTRGGSGSLRLDARGLAAWCTGFASPHTLVQLGRAEGPRELLDLAGALVAGPMPWMREGF
jgi:predicted acetyltransferase